MDQPTDWQTCTRCGASVIYDGGDLAWRSNSDPEGLICERGADPDGSDDKGHVPSFTWHDGDVVQTQVPYDDWPITIVREGGTWRAIGIPADRAPGDTHTDAEITGWVTEVATIKVRQEHQWQYGKDFVPHGTCFLCGMQYDEDAAEERRWSRGDDDE